MITNAAKIARLRLICEMRTSAYLMAYDNFSDAEVGAAEIRMVEAHRALQEALK